MTKRKNSDSSNYKYDMHDERPSKRRKKVIQRTGALERIGNVYRHGARGVRGMGENDSRVVQGLGTAAAAALGFITMNVPGAIIGGAYANEYLAPTPDGEEEDYMIPLVEAALGSLNKNKRVMPTYQGSFAAPYKVKKQNEDIYTSFGSFSVMEQYGANTGAESVYISACGFNLDAFKLNVAKAILRKLYRKVGIEITDSTQWICPTFVAKNYRFLFIYEDDNGSMTENTYTTVDNETLESLCSNSGMLTEIANYVQGSANRILVRIHMSVIDNYTTLTTPPILAELPRWIASINLKNEICHLYMSQTVTVQNRTKGAGEIGAASDVIDPQPLKGYLYYFKKNTPQTKQQNIGAPQADKVWAPFERTTPSGIMLISSGNGGVSPSMKDPPTPKFFTNCKKASYVRLEPGALKKFHVENTVSKYYVDLIRAASRFTGSNSYKRQNIADTMMLGLEEVMNSGSANLISLQYEAENKTGCYFTTGKCPVMVKGYAQNEVNNFGG